MSICTPASPSELADQLVESGEIERMEAALAAAERDPRLSAFAELIRFEWRLRTRPREAMAMIESRLPENHRGVRTRQ